MDTYTPKTKIVRKKNSDPVKDDFIERVYLSPKFYHIEQQCMYISKNAARWNDKIFRSTPSQWFSKIKKTNVDSDFSF